MQQPDVNASIKDKVRSQLFSCFCCVKPIVIRHTIGAKIRELNEQLERLGNKKDSYNLTEIHSQKKSRPVTSSIVHVSNFYGRQVDKEVIMDKLFVESTRSHHVPKVPVISIVGAGGFGKTTLAQQIINEDKVMKHFEKKMWVCVSNDFNLQKVAQQIIEEATGKVLKTAGWPAMHRGLSESIKGKLFILILDDVWKIERVLWNQLKTSLDGGATGSRIIITTRDAETAKFLGSSSADVHWLNQLSDEDSWSMFRDIAFQDREEDLKQLDIIARDITKKCKGIPLLISVLANAMLQKTFKDWGNVLANNIWDFRQGRDEFFSSILFSYDALPAKLKPCLMYCTILPKDAEIQKKEMVELWMAQGYLGSDGSKDLETVGGEYFDNLAMLSFYQDFKTDSKGNITSCKMHDSVYDVVQFLTKSEICILKKEEHESDKKSGENDLAKKKELESDKVRHLSTSHLDMSSPIYKQMKLRTLRPVMWSYLEKITHLELLHQLVCLRVLELCGSGLEELPSEIEKLLHLRYLNLSWTKIKELPETLCNLLNLQTLKLKGCSKVAKLPKGIGQLCNLRHLQISGTDNLKYLPRGLGKLSYLRTLNKFVTGDGDEIDNLTFLPRGLGTVDGNEIEGKGCNIRELKLLNHLQGELLISRLGRVANANEAAEAELEKKKNLQSLVLSFSKSEEENNADGPILEGLQPHTNLKKFRVMYYRGTKLPDWILSLSNVVKLDLVSLEKILQLPALAKLPYLEVLVLNELKSVKRIGEEFYGLSGYSGGRYSMSQQQQQIVFPKLKKLEFANMDAWEEWDLPYQNDNDIDFFPNLIELEIYQCNALQTLPPGLGKLKSLETLALKRFMGHEFLRILSNDGNKGVVEEDNGEFVKPAITADVVFPTLTLLELRSMQKWEGEMILELKVDSTTDITIMPHLSKLVIEDCPMLKVIPCYLFSQALRDLEISKCPKLGGVQPSLPPHLEKLTLSEDVGVLTSSLLPIVVSLHNNYQNLKSFRISYSRGTSLPKGFNNLTSIRQLQFLVCKSLDFMPDDLRHLTMLEQLHIKDCPLLDKQFREGSSSSSNVWPKQQKLAEIEESSQSDGHVRIGIMCDNCLMDPIVGKRYKCKDCWEERTRTERGVGFDLCEGCYHPCSDHPDIVNQHYLLGHTFELIANRW